jgi:hypothetical protein
MNNKRIKFFFLPSMPWINVITHGSAEPGPLVRGATCLEGIEIFFMDTGSVGAA